MPEIEEDLIYKRIQGIRREDRRYGRYAYQFALDLVDFAQAAFNRENAAGEGRHVTPTELLSQVEPFAFREFGKGAELVLQHHGLHGREDLGNVIDNLVRADLLSRCERDSWDCFSGQRPLVDLRNYRFKFE